MTTLQGPCNKTCLYIRIFSSLISAPKIHFWSGNSSELQEAWFWSDWIGWSLTTLQPSLPLSLCCCGLAGSPSVTQAACYFRHTDPGLGWGMYSCLTYGWNQILISNNASPPIWPLSISPSWGGSCRAVTEHSVCFKGLKSFSVRNKYFIDTQGSPQKFSV